MDHTHRFRRALAMLLVLSMLAAFALPAFPAEAAGAAEAAEASTDVRWEIEQIDNDSVTAESPLQHMGSLNSQMQLSGTQEPDSDEMVRVSIQLETKSTIDAGFQLKDIGTNARAMQYRSGLQAEQDSLQRTIERQVLDGQELDVVWNLTLAGNIISANVPRGAMEEIAELNGVKHVVEETRYVPDVYSRGGEYTPDMAISGQMVSAHLAWEEGYTGAGSTIAIIDTGLDTDHQSFDPDAFEHALNEVEAEKNITYDLMDAADIEAVLTQLNAYKKEDSNLTAAELYINQKTAYGYNYVDGDLDVTHDNDDQGGHGSHVAGIAAANRYIKSGESYVDALENVFVSGDAPDAQILVMKVFGKDGGAYNSDIMASIEDALILGADVVNLSLGSTNAGTAAIDDPTYQELIDKVVASGMVLAASAGNDGQWASYGETGGLLYSDGVNYDTVGTPGSYASFMAVASADNDGTISPSLVAGDTSFGYTEALTDSNGTAFGNTTITGLDTSEDGTGTAHDFVMIDGYGNPGDFTGMDLEGKIAVISRGGEVYYVDKANAAGDLGAKAVIVYGNAPGMVYMDLTGLKHNIPVVYVSQASGAAIRSAGTAQTAGELTYYTGSITVRAKDSAHYQDSEYKSISVFSSWGVPGDLSLKPDITAPGGDIYSVNGETEDTNQYFSMSGTSMAAPQVAGLAAIIKQYLEEENVSVSGMSERALTQALLMSTAEPMLASNGSYYPVIQQGSGLANVSAAVSTPVVMTSGDNTDGMVKVELGDDPQRKGTYSFSFTLHNLTATAHTYQLSADVFTQDIITVEGVDYQDLLTRKLDAAVTFSPASATVPASGSVTVNVTVALTEAEKTQLNGEYPNGAYIQAFVHAKPTASGDGSLLPELSMPVLGFYGNWSDPSMYDVGSQITYATGEETRDPYMGITYNNALGITYGDNPYEIWYFGGNPIIPDEKYLPERNALNTERGDYISQWSFAPIRNAAASRIVAKNTTTGEVWLDKEMGPISAAFYFYAYQSWVDTPQFLDVQLTPDLEEGESGVVSLTLAPEYYVGTDGKVDWEALGKGTTMEVPFTVDVEAPEILEVSVNTDKNVMEVTASDDQYLAGVILYDVTGMRRLGAAGTTADAKAGDTITFEIPLEGIDGYKFVIQTSDYAANFATYEIRATIGEPDPLPTRLVYSELQEDWKTFRKDSYYWLSDSWSETNITPNASTAIGEYAMVCDSKGNLYLVPVDDMTDEIYICKLPYVFVDMAYDYTTGTAYGLTEDRKLVTVDKYTGQTEEIGTVNLDTTTIAIDDEGTFYSIGAAMEGYYCYYSLYSYTLDDSGAITTPQMVGEGNSFYIYNMKTTGASSLEYDPYQKVLGLFIRNTYYANSTFYELNLQDGTCITSSARPFSGFANSLIYPRWGEEFGAWAAPTDTALSLSLAKDEVEVLLGRTAQLKATVLPWNLSNKKVIYTSSDTSVATVDATGKVTGVSLGTATIRAASAADGTIYDECTVTVVPLDFTVNGILRDEVGDPMFYTWNMASEEGLVRGEKLANPPMSVTRVPGTDTFYLLDSDAGTMHLLDGDGKDTVTPVDTYKNQNYWVWDLAYSNLFSTDDKDLVYGIREGNWLSPFDPMTETWFVSNQVSGASFLSGIAVGGTEKLVREDYYGTTEFDTEIIYMIDNNSNVVRVNVYQEYGRCSAAQTVKIPTDLNISYPVNFSGRSSLVVGEDGALYFSVWVGDTNELYRLVYDADTESYVSTFLDDFGTDVWPAVILDVHAHAYTLTETKEYCTEAGYKLWTCDCGFSYTEELAPTGHTHQLTDSKDATCTEAGYKKYVCHCGDTYTETINATGHTYTANVTKAPTCTEKGTTVYTCHCGDTYTETTDATGHTYTANVTKAPTCTEKGTTVYTCHCGDTYTETTNATGHSYKSVVTDPTTTSEGYTTHTCTGCGDSYKDSVTDKLPVSDSSNADTGDGFNAAAWLTLLVLSMLGMALVTFGRKRTVR